MTKEFCTYKQAMALKELDFDEPCLAFWDGKNTDAFYFNNIRDASGDYVPFQKHDRLKWFGAPLCQQAFRWFREKHGVYTEIFVDDDKTFGFMITHFTSEGRVDSPVKYGHITYEEAEQACLDKLIEIVKNNEKTH